MARAQKRKPSTTVSGKSFISGPRRAEKVPPASPPPPPPAQPPRPAPLLCSTIVATREVEMIIIAKDKREFSISRAPPFRGTRTHGLYRRFLAFVKTGN